MARPHSTARKSLLVTIGSVTNVLLGLAFQLLLANELGLSPVVDLYTLGTMVPTFLATILLGATPSVLVPAFTRLTRERTDGRVPIRVVVAPTLGVVIVTAIATASTVAAAPALSMSLPREAGEALVAFIVITAVSVPLAWAAAVSQAVLIVRERFLIVGLAGASNGLGLLAASIATFLADAPVPGLALAFVAGYATQVLVQSVAARRWMSWDAAPPSVPIIRSLALLMGSALIYKSQPVVERILASYVESGPAVLTYSTKITQALLMASSLGLSLISLPTISRHVSDDDHPRAFRFASGISFAICCISAPLVMTAIVGSENVVALLYGRGAFGRDDVAIVAVVLSFSAGGVLFSAMSGPIVNFLYATDRYRLVASVSISTTIGGAALSWVLREPLGIPGIVLGSVIVFVVNFAIFWFVAARSKDVHAGGRVLRSLLVIACVAAAAVGLSFVPDPGLPDILSDVTRLALLGIGTAAVSAALYVRLRDRDTVPPHDPSAPLSD